MHGSVRVTLIALAGTGFATPAVGQSLSDRISQVRAGTVRLSFATRGIVCGDGQFIGFDLPEAFYLYSNWNDGYSVNVMQDVKPDCRGGPLRLVVVKSGGRVTELRGAVGVSWRASETAVDLGTVGAAEAAEWLVGLAESDDDAVARTALLAAAAADSAHITGRVLALLQNRRLASAVRQRAIRWAAVIGGAEGRGDEVDQALRAVAADQAEPLALRERAVRDLRPTTANREYLRSLYQRVADATLRERILREVGSAGGEDEVAWVRGVALDAGQPVALRERAIRVLAEELDRPGEARALYPRLDRPALRERALRMAVEQGGTAEEAWAREVAEDRREDLTLRDRAIRLLAERGRGTVLRELYPRLERVELRERVVRSIAERNDAEAAAWLSGLVLDEREQPALRDRAVRELAERGAPSGELATLYDRVTSTAVKQRLIRLFAERRDAAAAEKLADIAGTDPDPALRSEAARRRK
jgi:DNA-binding transcriptional regulator YbjK